MGSSLCDSCHAACCRSYRLTITIHDFLDLVSLKGLAESINGTTFESIPFNANYFLNKNMMFPFIFDDLEKKDSMYILCLKRVASELLPGTQRCHFLDESKRPEKVINPELPGHESHLGTEYEGRCSVYSARPTMCRTYPIAFNPLTYQSVLKRRENGPQAAQSNVFNLCPKQNVELSDFGLDDPTAYLHKTDELMLNDIRTRSHNEAVVKWNSQPVRSIKQVINYFMSMQKDLIIDHRVLNKQQQAHPVVIQGATPSIPAIQLPKQSQASNQKVNS